MNSEKYKELVSASDCDNSNVQRCIEHGVTMADLFGAVLMGSKGSEHFDDEMNAFLDDVAGTIGDFIGHACCNQHDVVARFGDVLIESIADSAITQKTAAAARRQSTSGFSPNVPDGARDHRPRR